NPFRGRRADRRARRGARRSHGSRGAHVPQPDDPSRRGDPHPDTRAGQRIIRAAKRAEFFTYALCRAGRASILPHTQTLREIPANAVRRSGPGIARPEVMNATEPRATLPAQHEQIRSLLKRCTRLARVVRAGEPVLGELDAALGQLWQLVTVHNRTEAG